jgi:tRNA uridine 5-carboxymethylaminomethyl modification enzyme
MFTSRAEYRLSLREDNADLRLTGIGRSLGLVGESRWARFSEKSETITREQERLKKTWLHPESLSQEDAIRVIGQPLARAASLMELLRRSEVSYAALMSLSGAGAAAIDAEATDQLEIQAKYAGYIERQREEIELHRRHEETVLPTDFDYHVVRGLSVEVRQKLVSHRPATLGQAGRLSGITPAAISLLLVHLRRKRA